VTAVVVLSPLLLLFRRRFFLFLVGWLVSNTTVARDHAQCFGVLLSFYIQKMIGITTSLH